MSHCDVVAMIACALPADWTASTHSRKEAFVSRQPSSPRRRPAWRRRRTDTSGADDLPASKTTGREIRLVAVTAFVTVLVTTAATALVGTVTGWFDSVRERASSSDPVRSFVLLERDQQIQGETWVLPQALSVTPEDQKVLTGAYDHIDEFRDWARSHSGVDPSITVLELVVEGQSRHTVRMIGLRARIDHREVPLSGTLLFAGTEQGNDITQVGFDLDESDPVARTVRAGEPYADGYFGAPYFSARQTKTLDEGEQEVFQVTARTLKSYIEWYVEVRLLVDGKEQTVELRPAGRNIGTSAVRTTDNGTDFAAYKALYVMNVSDLSRGFVRQNPATYAPG